MFELTLFSIRFDFRCGRDKIKQSRWRIWLLKRKFSVSCDRVDRDECYRYSLYVTVSQSQLYSALSRDKNASSKWLPSIEGSNWQLINYWRKDKLSYWTIDICLHKPSMTRICDLIGGLKWKMRGRNQLQGVTVGVLVLSCPFTVNWANPEFNFVMFSKSLQLRTGFMNPF